MKKERRIIQMHYYHFYTSNTKEFLWLATAENKLPDMDVGCTVVIKKIAYFISSVTTVTIIDENEVRHALFLDEADLSNLKSFLADPVF
jgi:hypothetical protein